MITRRALFVGAAGFVVGCRAAVPIACIDTSGLTPEDIEPRKTLAYADTAADPAKTCASCKQYLAPPKAGDCGTCKLVKGPIHPRGFCKAFQPSA